MTPGKAVPPAGPRAVPQTREEVMRLTRTTPAGPPMDPEIERRFRGFAEAGRTIGLPPPTQPEFQARSRDIVRESLPISRWGEELLGRTAFEPKPGEPGFAGAYGRTLGPSGQFTPGSAMMGFAADESTVVHEWIHTVDPQKFKKLTDVVASQMPKDTEKAWRELVRVDPFHGLTEALMNPDWGLAGKPVPEEARDAIAPFIEPGAALPGGGDGPRVWEGLPSAFRDWLLTDVGENPTKYMSIARRDPRFARLMIQRMGIEPSPPGPGRQASLGPSTQPQFPQGALRPAATGGRPPGLARPLPADPEELEEMAKRFRRGQGGIGLPKELQGPKGGLLRPPPGIEKRRPESRLPRGIVRARLSEEELLKAIEEARKKAQTPIPEGADGIPQQTTEQRAAQREMEKLIEELGTRAGDIDPQIAQMAAMFGMSVPVLLQLLKNPQFLSQIAGSFAPSLMPAPPQGIQFATGAPGAFLLGERGLGGLGGGAGFG